MTEIDDFRMVPPDISWKPIKSKLVKVKEFPLSIDEVPIKEKKMLTFEALKEMESGKIFATGLTLIEHPWFNDAGFSLVDNRYALVRWVAVGGLGYPDWAIYHSLTAEFEPARHLDGFSHLQVPIADIARWGSKLGCIAKAKILVNADDNVCRLYNF